MNEDLELLRKALWPLSMAYGLALWVRNWLFDAGLRRTHAAGVPVVSVGNIAVGGTGKTPLVVWLVEQALARGLRPGVLARGYGRAAGAELNDEGLLLARRFPGLCQVQDPDRVRGARRLVEEMQVDLIILDDGFQHRRLRRDWDVVCLDTVRPFAGGLLPVGRLREHPKALCRAHAVVLTRADGVAPAAIEERCARLRELAPQVGGWFAAAHVPARLLEMPGGGDVGLHRLQGARVVLLSAIARPASFAETVADLGAEVVDHVQRRDHHRHTAAELAAARERADRQDALLVTTEKDEVKLAGMDVPRLVLELQLQFLGAVPEIGSAAPTFLSFRAPDRP